MPEHLLSRYPLFELLGSKSSAALLDDASEVEFHTGEVLFQEGTSGAWVHLLVEGRVRILRRLADGREASLGTARPGELVGEYVLLTPHQHTATCRASSDCRVLRLPVGRIRKMLKAGGIGGGVLKKLIRLHASLHFLTGRQYLGFMSASSALLYADLLCEQRFRAVSTIQAPGVAQNRWFTILEGSVVVSKPDGMIREYGPGQCFGNLLPDGSSAATVVGLTDVRCLSLTFSEFLTGQASANIVSDLIIDESRQSLLTQQQSCGQFPWRAQQSEVDCGLASLKMVAHFLGTNIDEELSGVGGELPAHGISLLQLRDIARSQGLRAEAFRIDPDHINDVDCPVIAHLKSGHYVVIFSAETRALIVADPATGISTVWLDHFRTLWSGYLLTFKSQ